MNMHLSFSIFTKNGKREIDLGQGSIAIHNVMIVIIKCTM